MVASRAITLLWLQRGLGIDAEECSPTPPTASRPSTSFNGASASMPRNARNRKHDRLRRAASTGPRHRCRGMLRVGGAGEPAFALQRGLGIDAEEWRPSRPGTTCSSRLQRGLGIDAEECGCPHEAPPRPQSLQRGLGIDAEECTPIRLDRNPTDHASTGPRHRCRGMSAWPIGLMLRRSGFNGASASMPRNAEAQASAQNAHSLLQRGLGIDAEE